jgi:hypothetical protein
LGRYFGVSHLQKAQIVQTHTTDYAKEFFGDEHPIVVIDGKIAQLHK